jgi:hypothetical protein
MSSSLTDPEDVLDATGRSGEQQLDAAALNGAKLAVFPGDTGELPLDTRRVLVQLLLGPSLDVRRQTKLWPVLIANEALLRSRLHDLFLELIVDHEQRVAFTRQVTADDINPPVLLRKANLTFIETALLLFLRQRLTQADAQGERAAVSLQDILEYLKVFERESNSDRAKFDKQCVGAVEKAKKLNLIRQLSGADKRFEVAPTLKLLFSAEEIQQLVRTYASLADKQDEASAPGGDEQVDSDGDADVDSDDEGGEE